VDHQIRSIARTTSEGEVIEGMDDYTCAGCHQGSNRTVMQYWGIRLDQNQDLVNDVQYPAAPKKFKTTENDERLFDPDVANNTFNGRNANQYILTEDYDGDGRDDTPADVHYEAGLGCIDCHGSRDLHGGTAGDPTSGDIMSRMSQAVMITCESCHGTIDSAPATTACTTYDGEAADCAIDAAGNPLRHVTVDPATGGMKLVSRLTGQEHFLPKVVDVVADNGVVNPQTGESLYSPHASYAMGRNDGDDATGTGPLQESNEFIPYPGFSHSDEMTCTSCHASWTNNCIGCHLAGGYDDDPDNFFFSNVTGERSVFFQANADFVYQTPVPFQLGVDEDNKVAPIAANSMAFFRWYDRNGDVSDVFAFSDRNGNGNNPGVDGRGELPAMAHNIMAPHSIRGKVESDKEGPRYCVACHLTTEGLEEYGDEYEEFRTALAENDFESLNFKKLKRHIGRNTGNQLNSPFWVNMVSGLGSGLFLFDENGCPVNPLDDNANRQYCQDGAPADNFDGDNAVFNTDRIVEPSGVSNASSGHPMSSNATGVNKRDGALNPNMTGPLGKRLLTLLADPETGLVLDSWLDADGVAKGPAFLPKCDGLTATIVGTEGDDVIDGTNGDDVIHALGGDDRVNGKKGNDIICGGAGNDILRGSGGNDDLFGENGDDLLRGDGGVNLLDGGAGDDILRGGPDGLDTCEGGEGDNTEDGCKEVEVVEVVEVEEVVEVVEVIEEVEVVEVVDEAEYVEDDNNVDEPNYADGVDIQDDQDSVTGIVDYGNQPPVLSPIGARMAYAGQLLALTVSASDADDNALRFSATGLPNGANLYDNGDGTAQLRWTPIGGELPYSITVTVSDGQSSDAETFQLTTVSNEADNTDYDNGEVPEAGEGNDYSETSNDSGGGGSGSPWLLLGLGLFGLLARRRG